MKNRYIRIGISLLIALCFILPAGSFMAQGNEAATTAQTNEGKVDQRYQSTLDKISPMSRTDGTIIEQATNTQIVNVYMEKCGVSDDNSKIPLTGVPPIINGRPAIPMADCYTPVFQLLTTDIPTRFEPEIEIYEIACNDEFCIYENSFEDNARNYLEWQQIDLDCGYAGTYYDGWSWSDARACCGDHSFKNTMYDEYKNMQQDLFMMKEGFDFTKDTYELCDGTILEDVSVGAINVSFDIFVDGEWAPWGDDDYEPLDFLQFRIYCALGYATPFDLDFADTSMDIFDFWSVSFLNYAKKSDCPGWWHVWFEIELDDLNPVFRDDFIPAFYWESDKERVYEGAYVDCFKVTITDETQNKVYQGHSQSWLTEDDVNTPIGIWSFPLDWTGFRETISKVNCKDQDCGYYRAVCKIKTDDGGYLEPIIIDFEVGEVDMNEIQDILVEDDFDHVLVPDGGVLDYPSDAHVKFTYHNGGSVPVYDVPITFSAYALVEETLASYDMESGFSYYYFTDWDQTYLSNDFAWSGSRSMAFNNPDTMHYDACGGYGMLFGDAINMECVEDVCLDFYYMGKIGPGASFHFVAGAETGGVTLDMRDTWQGLVDNQKTGVTVDDCGDDCIGEEAKWIGPMQPYCNYACIDLDAVWTEMAPYAIGPDGEQTYNLLYGFVLGGSAGYWGDLPEEGVFYYCDTGIEETDWSGVYVDDVTVTAKVLGEKVYSETMIIPGPIDPCETYTDQFTWEDPDFSCYRVVIEADGCYDPFDCYNNIDQYWYKYSDFCVLEAKEKMTKQTDTDYSECTPEAWCISDVVGNDCGEGIDPATGEQIYGSGDHYALATNCDTWQVPVGVNDYIALGPVNSECADGCTGPIDVSHLYVSGAGGGNGGCTPQTIGYDDGSTENAFAWNDNSPWISCIGFDATELTGCYDGYIEDVTFSAGCDLYGFYAVDYEIRLATARDDLLTASAVASGTSSGTGWDTVSFTPWTIPSSGEVWIAVYYPTYDLEFPAGFDTSGGNPTRAMWSYYSTDDIWYDASALGYPGSTWGLHATACCPDGTPLTLGYNCTIDLTEGFEGIPIPNGVPAGWTTDYYFYNIGPVYGNPPHTGQQMALSFSMDDKMISPTLWFKDKNTLSFWYAVDDALFAQNLVVSVDGTEVWSHMGFTHEADATQPDNGYQQVILTTELAPYANGNHTIEFWNPGPSNLGYPQLIDDIEFESCVDEGPDIVPKDIWVNFTYQIDMDFGEVIVEYAHYNVTDGDECCPPGETAWTQLGNPITGRDPGTCHFFSQPITITQTHLCFRIRLDTSGQSDDDDIWGIGFHMHEIFISDIIYDAFDNMTYDFYEDFEDGTIIIPDQPGESTNLEWCIDCVRYGVHWHEISDFEFICGGEEIPGIVPFGCKEFTLDLTDSFGDGWNTEWPASDVAEAFVDVSVNGVPVIVGATVEEEGFGGNGYFYADTFDACSGDLIEVTYYELEYMPYHSEHYWSITDEDGVMWAEDGVGWTAPAQTTTSIDLPLEVFEIPDGAFWPAEPIDTACVWETEIEDCYEAYLFGEWMYSIPAYCRVTFEVSIDGGDNWFVIAQLDGPAEQLVYGPIPCTMFDLTPFVGHKILVRTHVDNYGANPGWLMIKDYQIFGKQDMLPPVISISLAGNTVGAGMYAGPVTVTLTATDNKGVKEIHYILDGTESVVAGSTATFTVSGDGAHTVSAWAVDNVGNIGNTVEASFSIDNTPPTVAITAPTPGLYLFGNQLLSMSKAFIIGAFTIEATADDAQGVASVEFFLNGESLGADLEAPFSTYCAVKNMGAAEITAVATDGVGNTAEDSLDVTYYKFL